MLNNKFGLSVLQRTVDVLQRLDSVPWADLEHAYGSAADVPTLLRKLLDPGSESFRNEVLSILYSNVFHQGTRLPGNSSRHFRFLIEMRA